MIAGASSNANDETRATGPGTARETPGGGHSGKQPIGHLFRAALKAITGDGEDETPEPKKRRGDTEGDFARLGRWFARPFASMRRSFKAAAGEKTQSQGFEMPAAAYAAAAGHLFATLDWLNPFHNEADNFVEIDNNFEAQNSDLSSLDL